MKIGKLVGQRALYLSKSNLWDMSHHDKQSLTYINSDAAHTMPSLTFSPLVEPDAQIPCPPALLPTRLTATQSGERAIDSLDHRFID